jgi:hypothetical protein
VPFPEFYVKIENGFVAQENCFVARVPTKQNQKANDFNYLYRPLNQFDRSLADATPDSNVKAVHFDEPNLACADSLGGAQLLLDCASPFNLNRGTGRGQWPFRSRKTTHEPPTGRIDDSRLDPIRPLSRNGYRRQNSGQVRHERNLRGDVGAAWSRWPQRPIGAAKIRSPGGMSRR